MPVKRMQQGAVRTHQPVLTLLAVVIIAAICFVLLLTEPEPEAKLQEPIVLSVNVIPVMRETLAPTERLVGRLRPARRADLRFEVAGQVEKRLVEPGMQVQEGDVLIALREGDLQDIYTETQASYRMEKSGIERDRSLLELARKNRTLQIDEVERLEQLGQKSLSSRSQLDAARQQLFNLEAEVARLQHSVGTAESRLRLQQSAMDRAHRNLQRAELRAPFAGTVNSVEIEVGDTVSINDPVLTLIDAKRLDLYLEVRGEVVANLQLGQIVPVELGERMLQSHVQALELDPDPLTSTHAIRLRLKGNHARPGLLATAVLPLGVMRDVQTIPVSSVLSLTDGKFVYRYRDGVLERVAVKLAARIGNRMVVKSGLADGDLIVSQDVAALSDGQSVRLESAP